MQNKDWPLWKRFLKVMRCAIYNLGCRLLAACIADHKSPIDTFCLSSKGLAIMGTTSWEEIKILVWHSLVALLLKVSLKMKIND